MDVVLCVMRESLDRTFRDAYLNVGISNEGDAINVALTLAQRMVGNICWPVRLELVRCLMLDIYAGKDVVTQLHEIFVLCDAHVPGILRKSAWRPQGHHWNFLARRFEAVHKRMEFKVCEPPSDALDISGWLYWANRTLLRVHRGLLSVNIPGLHLLPGFFFIIVKTEFAVRERWGLKKHGSLPDIKDVGDMIRQIEILLYHAKAIPFISASVHCKYGDQCAFGPGLCTYYHANK